LIFLSTLFHRSIFDIEGHRLGVLKDVSVSLRETFPIVTGLVVTPVGPRLIALGNNDMVIPWSQVENLEAERIHLTIGQERIASYTPHQDELLLGRDLLDTQIVDTQGFRVVKVNDLKLAQIKGTARLIGADISFSGLLRRLAARACITKRVHPHGLRHTFAVELEQAGTPVSVISKLLGHSSVAVTARYLDHLTNGQAVTALESAELPAL